jgi:hypothetical protein
VGRPSKLTQGQWGEVERRLLSGETARALGREFGVSDTAIIKKFGANKKVSLQSLQVRNVAEKLATANSALAALPPAQRPIAISLSEKLMNISNSLASAAEMGAATAHRLNALANSEVAKIDDVEPLKSVESLKGVAILTRLANDSAGIALNLMSANKDAISRLNEAAPTEPRFDPRKISSAALEEFLASRD